MGKSTNTKSGKTASLGKVKMPKGNEASATKSGQAHKGSKYC